MKRENLAATIKKTIDYANKYGQRLTIDQLEQRLISSRIWEGKEIRDEVLGKNIKVAKGKGVNREAERKTRLASLVFNSRWIEMLPIEMVAVTGSVAAGNPNKNDDIDILIVTNNNRLWLTRIVLILWMRASKIRMRKLGQKESKDELCLNLWLEDDYLEIPKVKRNLRSAMDMINMTVIRDNGDTKIKMIKANPWVKNFLATGMNKIVRTKISGRIEIKFGWLGDVLNKIAFIGQYWYMRKKITGEIVNKHQSFYHPMVLS